MVNPVIPSVIPAAPTPTTPLGSRGDVALQIIDTTGDLRDVKTAIPNLNGEIKSASRDGSVIITTPRGDITAKLPPGISAQPGQQITINVPAGKPPTSITVQPRASAPAQPHQPDLPQTPDPSTTVPKKSQGQLELNDVLRATAQLPPNPNANTVSPGQIVQLKPITLADAATLLKSNLGALTNLANQGVLPPPQLVALQNILKILTPTPASGAPGLSPLRDAPLTAPTLPGAPQPMPTLSPTAPTLPPLPGAEPDAAPLFTAAKMPNLPFEARIDTILPPTIGAPAPPPPVPTTSTLTLFTLTSDTNGHLIFAAPTQTTIAPPATPFFLMPMRGDNLIPGTTLNLTPQPLLPGIQPAAATPLTALTDLTPDALVTFLNTLTDADLQTLYGPAHQTPPMANAKTPSTVAPAALFFMAALRAGDLDGFIGGPAAQALRNLKKSGALEKLEDLFRTGKQTLSDPTSGDFKSYVFPMQFDQTVHAIKLHMRREDGNQDDDTPGRENKRFVLEVNFDRMGPVQLDMLYQPQTLDTVLRTQLPLSNAMRTALELTYAKAMGNVGHAGTLYFQDGLNTWVTVDERPSNAMQVLA